MEFVKIVNDIIFIPIWRILSSDRRSLQEPCQTILNFFNDIVASSVQPTCYEIIDAP